MASIGRSDSCTRANSTFQSSLLRRPPPPPRRLTRARSRAPARGTCAWHAQLLSHCSSTTAAHAAYAPTCRTGTCTGSPSLHRALLARHRVAACWLAADHGYVPSLPAADGAAVMPLLVPSCHQPLHVRVHHESNACLFGPTGRSMPRRVTAQLLLCRSAAERLCSPLSLCMHVVVSGSRCWIGRVRGCVTMDS